MSRIASVVLVAIPSSASGRLEPTWPLEGPRLVRVPWLPDRPLDNNCPNVHGRVPNLDGIAIYMIYSVGSEHGLDVNLPEDGVS